MSSRSIYLRDQAAKCEFETEVALRKLAAEYVIQADEIETNESGESQIGPGR
jgi:hypothetical protein